MKAARYLPASANLMKREPVLVDLNADGSANLSRLPENVRQHLLDFGFPNPLHTKNITAKDGELFLAALVASTNPYFQFRSADSDET